MPLWCFLGKYGLKKYQSFTIFSCYKITTDFRKQTTTPIIKIVWELFKYSLEIIVITWKKKGLLLTTFLMGSSWMEEGRTASPQCGDLMKSPCRPTLGILTYGSEDEGERWLKLISGQATVINGNLSHPSDVLRGKRSHRNNIWRIFALKLYKINICMHYTNIFRNWFRNKITEVFTWTWK